MKRHLSLVLIVAGVFVFFMAQAEASDVCMLTAVISNRYVNMMDVVSRIPVYIRLFLDAPPINFRIEGISFGAIENIKQIEQSV